MCRAKTGCSELGINPGNWDQHSPLRRPGWMLEQLDIFENAVHAFLADNKAQCIELIQQINSEAIIDWYIEHGQMAGRHRRLHLQVVPPVTISLILRDQVRSPKKLQEQVFIRDGYRCRYCGNKLISQDFIRLFILQLDSSLFKRGNTNLTTHGIIHLTWPVADHVIPWNLGGRTEMSNLVASCPPCNYGKDGNTIEQIGIDNPFNRPPIVDSWKGFSDNIEELKQRQ